MKNWLWPALLLGTVLLCVLSLPAQTGSISTFRSAFADRPVPTRQGKEDPLVSAVYLVVIDGLRHDTAQSKAMPYLNQLRSRAAWGELRAGLPSYSRPAYERILSGAPSDLTGLTMNDQTDSSPVPTIFGLAAAAGLRTAASAHRWISDLVDGMGTSAKTGRFTGRNIQLGYYYEGEDEPDSRVFAAAKEFVRTGNPNLLLVLPGSVDAAGHRSGGASTAYRRSAAAADAALADFFYALPARDYLAIVTADHGHRNAGGHGGEERTAVEVPFFLFGPGVRAGQLTRTIDQLDLAPTIAAALGLPMAGSMGGRVLTEAFLAPGPWQARAAKLQQVQSSYLAANADLLGKGARQPGATFTAAWRQAKRVTWLRGLLWRLPLALLFAAAAMTAVVFLARQLQWRWPMLAGVTFPLYFFALLRLFRYDYSYSAIVSASDFATKAALAAAVALFILTWAGAALRRGRESFFWSISLGVWAVQCLFTVAAWLVVGGRPHLFLPDLGWQVFYMVQLLVTGIVALYALAGWGVIRLVQRRVPAVSGRPENPPLI